MSAVVNATAIGAIFRRETAALLGNPLGYVFILAFAVGAAVLMFWVNGDAYLKRMVADLQPLNDTMPLLLAMLLPALAMGVWAREREQGTEELLLTMPLSTVDAVLGKWLALVAFASLALLCTIANPLAIEFHGNPDWGAIAAQYFGWWLAAAVGAAVALLGSVMVAQSSLAFVLGAVLCLMVLGHAYVRFMGEFLLSAATFGAYQISSTWTTSWFDAFNRGVVPLGHVVGAVAVAAAALGTAIAVIARRRWHPARRGTAWGQVASLLLAVLVAVNASRIADRFGADGDLTSEGLSSLSGASAGLVRGLAEPVTIHAFISPDDSLPDHSKPKAQQVLAMLAAVQRAARGKVAVRIYRPTDAFSDAGRLAEKDFSLRPRQEEADRLTGRQTIDVYLAAAVTSGSRTTVIEHFDPGLSVEYELMVAINGVATARKPKLGVAVTDLALLGEQSFNPQMMMMGGMGGTPEWEIVKEWRRQYDIERVDLASPVNPELKALVVAQPSTLTQAEMLNLHQWIWNGGATLLLEDPAPMFQAMGAQRTDLIPGERKRNPNADPRGGGGEDGPQKGDLRPLMTALGLDWTGDQLIWSRYLPSDEFRNMIPASFLWSRRTTGPADNPLVAGVGDLLMAMPGELKASPNAPGGLRLTPLLSVTSGADWGRMVTGDVVERGWRGIQGIKQQFEQRPSGEPTKRPALAMEITGTMPAAWPMTLPVPAGATASATAAAGVAAIAPGTSSPKPVRVVVVADVDWIGNEFFGMYRNQGNRLDRDQVKFLQSLRNVTFTGNLVDSLTGYGELIPVRIRRPQPRVLETIDAAQTEVAKAKRSASEKAQRAFDDAMAQFSKDVNKTYEELERNQDLDPALKEQLLKEEVERKGARLAQRTRELEQQRAQTIRAETAVKEREMATTFMQVKLWPSFIPFAILVVVAIMVFEIRRQNERTSIPAARKRA